MTELSREEVLRIAESCNCGWIQRGTEPTLFGEIQIERFAAAIYEAGAAAERAVSDRLLAESQARESAWRDHYLSACDMIDFDIGAPEEARMAREWVRGIGSGSTALDAAIAKAKREENEACARVCEDKASVHGWNYHLPSVGRELAHIIRTRMADELKGSEQ